MTRTAEHSTERRATITQSPPAPHPALRSLDRFVGTWEVSGAAVSGRVHFEWFEGGHFLVHHGEIVHGGRAIRFVEYVGYDPAVGSCTSHLFDNHGHAFTYTWDLEGDEMTIWFVERGSSNRFTGRFDADGKGYSGAWAWPGGGYEVVARRVG